MQAGGGKTQSGGSVPRGSCVALISGVAPVSSALGSSPQDAVWFQELPSRFLVFFLFSLEPFHFNSDDPFPRSTFSVLGRSRQQGKR